MWIPSTDFDHRSRIGDSISLLPAPHPPWAIIVPFALPGERIRARVHRNLRLHSLGDLLSVEKTNETMRDMSLVKCQYFGKCGGCQYQVYNTFHLVSAILIAFVAFADALVRNTAPAQEKSGREGLC